MTGRTSSWRWKHYGTASVVAAGLIAGSAVLGAPAASATASTRSVPPSAPSSTSQTTATTRTVHPLRAHRARRTPLTAAVVAKVKAAVLAKYPGATVRRVGTDLHGVYTARLVATAGVHVVVKVSKTFTIISVHEFGHAMTARSAVPATK